jgi:hypothetical protein
MLVSRATRPDSTQELAPVRNGRRYNGLVRGVCMSDLLTIDEGKALVALCRAGKLYGIERWIASGKSIGTPPSIKRTPLPTAINTGFHRLVELLARNKPWQQQKDRALVEAVKGTRRCGFRNRYGREPCGL